MNDTYQQHTKPIYLFIFYFYDDKFDKREYLAKCSLVE